MSPGNLDPPFPAVETVAQTRESIQSAFMDLGIIQDPEATPSFEYIIIGGGTAGLAIAARLAEALEPGRYVCVIEAGLYQKNAAIDVPGLVGERDDDQYNWSYLSVPQPSLDGRRVPCSAGRLLGGSSGINYLVRMRASSPEYDAWDEFGSGWNWDGLLPYFKAEERHESYVWGTDQIFPGITQAEDEKARERESEFRGHSGPVHSTHNTIYTDLLKPTIETTLKFGIQTNRTPSYGNSTGMFNIDGAVNRREGTRSYAANAYLQNPERILPQKNVIVLHGVYAERILFGSGGGGGGEAAQAIGVACLTGVDWKSPVNPSTPFNLNTKGEIIVSAGAYNTPRLLELSGVGNPAILSQFNIPIVVDLPAVGENLQEHPSLLLDFTVKEGVFTLDRLRNDPVYRKEQWKEYCEKKTGAYATTVAAYGFIKLKNFLTTGEVNELKGELESEILRTNNSFHKRQLEIQREYLDHDGVGDIELIMVPKVFASDPKENTSYITLVVCLPHPVARGTVHIASADPFDPPSINPRYLDNLFDFKILMKAAQFVRKLSETAPLKDIIVAPSTPGPDVQTDGDFEKFVRGCLNSFQHPIGTSAMAPKSLGGVVDEQLRVHGTQNVRVVDMSIAPLHLAAHLVDTAYAIGEKAADMIKGSRTTERMS